MKFQSRKPKTPANRWKAGQMTATIKVAHNPKLRQVMVLIDYNNERRIKASELMIDSE
jgi:hypothetical protein